MKWILVIALIVLGVIAAIVAIEYLTVPIYKLPSFMPGHGLKLDTHHYTKRGALAGLVAIAAFVGAGILIARDRRSAAPAQKSSASAGDLLSGSDPDADSTPGS